MLAKTRKNEMLPIKDVFQTIIPTPIGDLLAEATHYGLFGLSFFDNKREIIQQENDCLKDTKNQLDEYFAGSRINFTIPLILDGSDFQKKVWNILLKINYGITISYKEEAMLISKPKAYRAVANANGKNPISIITPCHRVIASNGTMGGYSGGVWRKEFLLNLESHLGKTEISRKRT